jgi:hypothetical protein
MIFGRYDEKGEHQQPKVVEAQVGSERSPRPLYPEPNRP